MNSWLFIFIHGWGINWYCIS